MFLQFFLLFAIIGTCSPQLVVKPVMNKINTTILIPRVINGRAAKPEDVPYQISFRKAPRNSNRYTTFCGGILIGSLKILTAAHCFETKRSIFDSDCGSKNRWLKKKNLQVYAVAGNIWTTSPHPDPPSSKQKKKGKGIKINKVKIPLTGPANATANTTKPSATPPPANDLGQWRALARGVYPQKYKFPKADICIIWTKRHFIMNAHVAVIPYASKRIEYNTSMTCLASGYGRTSRTSSAQATQLLMAELETIPTVYCNQLHRRNMKDFVCTSAKISDTAKGDSGGPLVCKNTGDRRDKGKGVAVGLVSGHRKGVGSFFTRISSHSNFIKRGAATRVTHTNVLLVFIIYATFYLG